jgi:hypothetical protein
MISQKYQQNFKTHISKIKFFILKSQLCLLSMRVNTHTEIHIDTHKHMYIHKHINRHKHTCIFKHTYTQQTHTHTNTHTTQKVLFNVVYLCPIHFAFLNSILFAYEIFREKTAVGMWVGILFKSVSIDWVSIFH